MFSPRRSYRVSRYLVSEPEFGFHHRFHIRFDEDTSVIRTNDPYVDRVFNLRAPTDIPACKSLIGTIYG